MITLIMSYMPISLQALVSLGFACMGIGALVAVIKFFLGGGN